MAVPILNPQQNWACPNCNATDVTHEARPHTRMHACAGLSGITAPMIPAKETEKTFGKTRVRAIVREDYVGNDHVTTDGDGRPIMAVETQRPDGSTDWAVMAPLVKGRGVI